MADFDFAPATAGLSWGEPVAVLDTGGGTTGDGTWSALICERDGTVVTPVSLYRIDTDEYRGLNIGKIKRRLNGGSTLSPVQLPKAWADVGEAKIIEREIQVFRSGRLQFVGPLLDSQADSDSGAFNGSAVGVEWYLKRRLRGGYVPWSRNYIANPRFDDGFARWTLVGDGIVLDGDSETGTDSAKLPNGSGTHLSQSVLIDIAVRYQAVIEVRVKLSATATGRGVEVTVPGVGGGTSFRSAPITAATPVGAWTTLPVQVEIEGRVGARTLTVDTYAATGGDLLVDHESVTIFPITSLPESSPAPVPQVDQAKVIRETVLAVNRGLNLGVSCPDTGVLVDYEPDEDVDRYASEVIDRYVKREGGVEWEIVATPATRTFTTHHPRMGVDHDPAEVTLRWVPEGDEPRNCSSYRIGWDGSEAVSEMTTVGEGDYRGVYQDPEAWGGLLLQGTQQAAEGTPLADLEGLSRKALRAAADDVQSLSVTVTDGELIDVVRLGDRVLVVIGDLAVQVNAVYRVVEQEIDPATDNMVLTLNVEPV